MSLNTRPAPTLKYYGYDPASGEETLLPRHSLVFSETKEHGTWTKDFDGFYELYMENAAPFVPVQTSTSASVRRRPPQAGEKKSALVQVEAYERAKRPAVGEITGALVPMEAFIYRHLLSLSNRGLAIKTADYASWLHLNENRLIDHLDRLQDAFLLYRVCRIDTHGQPNDLVLQTPLTRKQWKTRGEEVLFRLETGVTKIERRAAGRKKWPGKDRQFSQQTIIQACGGNERQAEEFTRMVLDVLFTMKSYDAHQRKDFEKGLLHTATKKSVMMSDKLFAAAFEIKKRYAPTLF